MATITKIRSINFNPLFFEEENSSLVEWVIRYNEKAFCTLTTNVVRVELCLNQYGVFIHRFYILNKEGKTIYKTSSCEECAEYLNEHKKELILDTLINLSKLDERTLELIKAVGLYEEGGAQ